MTQLSTFNFGGRRVRTAGTPEAPLFCVVDVCAVLEILNPSQAGARLDDDEKAYVEHSPGQNALYVTEAGLYSLILGSRKPEAKAFKRWVTSEVLPTIRKTGSYGKQDLVAALTDPATALKIIGTYAEKVIALQGEVEASRPKVEVYDRIIETGDTVGFREACKLIFAGTGAKEHEVRGFMLKAGWIQRLGGNLAPASYGQAQGYVTTRDREITTADGRTIVRPELRITQRGLARAIVRLNESEAAQ